MEEPETTLYHVEPFHDALGEGRRVLRSEGRVYEVREHDDRESMVYWTSDTPSGGAEEGYYAKVRVPVQDDEEAYTRFLSFADRLADGYGVALSIDPRTFHGELAEGTVVDRSTDDFKVRYVQENQLDPEPFGGTLLQRLDGRRIARLDGMTLLDLEDTFERLNRRNALSTVIPEMDHYDRALNEELDALEDADLYPKWKAMKRYRFYDHHKLPGVTARHLAPTYDEAVDALRTMLGGAYHAGLDTLRTGEEVEPVETSEVHTNPDAFERFLDALSFQDADGRVQLVTDGETLLRNALEQDDRPELIDAHLDEHYSRHVKRIKNAQWLDGHDTDR